MFRLRILRRVTRQPTKGSPLWSLNLETVCTSVHGCIRTHWEDQSSGIRSGDSKWTQTWTEACARVHARPISAYTGAAVRETSAVYAEFSTKRSKASTFSFRHIRPWTFRTGTDRFVKLIRPANARNFKSGIPPPVKTRSVAANFANGEKSYLVFSFWGTYVWRLELYTSGRMCRFRMSPILRSFTKTNERNVGSKILSGIVKFRSRCLRPKRASSSVWNVFGNLSNVPEFPWTDCAESQIARSRIVLC